jgi:hypothetical protein
MLMSATNMIGFSWLASPVGARRGRGEAAGAGRQPAIRVPRGGAPQTHIRRRLALDFGAQAGTELEAATMDWLAQLCGLPPAFLTSSGGAGGGCIQGTSSEAVVVALLAARARALRGRPAADTLRLVAYGSSQTHSCYQKACKVVGIQHTRTLPTRAEDGWALRAADLEAAMSADAAAGLIPCFLVATIGTTSSCAVDEVGPLAAVASAHGAWTHVDAAYAGATAILPEQRQQHFQGLEAVDSYSFNPHKWLLTNFDCCALWAADLGPLREALSLSATPAFLRGAGQLLDYKDLQARGVLEGSEKRVWWPPGNGQKRMASSRPRERERWPTPLNSKHLSSLFPHPPPPGRSRWAGAGARSSCTLCSACTEGRRCRRTCGTTWRWRTGWWRRRARRDCRRRRGATAHMPPPLLGRCYTCRHCCWGRCRCRRRAAAGGRAERRAWR